MPTLVASSVLVSVEDAKLPSAKIDDPTVTSANEALAPSLVYVVALDTITVPLEPLGPVIVMVSPLTAVTLPITLGSTMAMLAAVVEPDAMGTTCTSSPTASSALVAATRSFVNVVDEVMV
jgi:hypothetical protein